jgi:glyoxylase-like metal-dependent hydrolase (beta-lactamase superfamily II)
MPAVLPEGVRVFERGWLSSNNVLLLGEDRTVLVDSGYCTHADQTLALVAATLSGRPLDVLINTHLHSDHCGGNTALQTRYPALQTLIPPGHAAQVRDWDETALSYQSTGQQCPRFRADAVLRPGSEWRVGGQTWQVHAAPGHDPHSIILFEPLSRIAISADALWERGFGVVFPELDGEAAFDEVAATLEVIERLDPVVVIPGHGAVFVDVHAAIAYARQRLNGFVQNPSKHLRYAAKVLLKFKLLDSRQIPLEDLLDWVERTPYFSQIFRLFGGDMSLQETVMELLSDLVRSGAARLEKGYVFDAE